MKTANTTAARFLTAIAAAAISASAFIPSTAFAKSYSFSFDDPAQNEPFEEMSFDKEEPIAASEDGTVTNDGESVRFAFNDSEEFEELNVPDHENVFSAGESIITRNKDQEYEYTVDTDPRTPITDTTAYPYSAICKLTMTFQDANGEQYSFVGSGYVINANTILTCGHCVYDHENKLGWVKSIWIEPGRNGSARPFTTYSSRDVDYIEVDEQWITKRGPEDNDNALIVLKKNIGEQTGILPLSTAGASASQVHLSGYPAKYQKKYNAGTQVHAYGNVLEQKNRCLEFDVYGSGGQSGSPVFNEKGEVIATYAYSYVFRNRTGGPIIDAERLAWINKYAGKPVAAPVPSNSQPVAMNKDKKAPVAKQVPAPAADNKPSEPAKPAAPKQETPRQEAPKQDAPKQETPKAEETKSSTVFRLYNPNSGEHFYTMNAGEKDSLAKIGWKYEGISWNSSSSKDAQPVYRVYNPNSGDHHYTTDKNEYETLGKLGWKKEGTSWMAVSSKTSGAVPVYRVYNPNAKVGQHHFTKDQNEAKALIAAGWKDENIGFYTVK